MINLKQIQALEKKINNAVELIGLLKRENKALKKAIDSSQKRVEDLESLVNEFKSEQFEIEKSVLNALTKLDELEDDVTDAANQSNKITQESKESGSDELELNGEEEGLNTPVEESVDKNEAGDNEKNDEDIVENQVENHTEKKEKTDDTVSLEDDSINELDIF